MLLVAGGCTGKWPEGNEDWREGRMTILSCIKDIALDGWLTDAEGYWTDMSPCKKSWQERAKDASVAGWPDDNDDDATMRWWECCPWNSGLSCKFDYRNLISKLSSHFLILIPLYTNKFIFRLHSSYLDYVCSTEGGWGWPAALLQVRLIQTTVIIRLQLLLRIMATGNCCKWILEYFIGDFNIVSGELYKYSPTYKM